MDKNYVLLAPPPPFRNIKEKKEKKYVVLGWSDRTVGNMLALQAAQLRFEPGINLPPPTPKPINFIQYHKTTEAFLVGKLMLQFILI